MALPSISMLAPAACAPAKLPARSDVVYAAGHFCRVAGFLFYIEVQPMALPTDPIMLLSVINLKLRDFYPSLDALCEDLGEDKAALCASLACAGYEYDAQQNRFV